MSLIDDIRNVLEGAKGPDGSFTARCPAHDDKMQSLSVRLPRDTNDPDGIIELKCFTGCDRERIVEALKARGVVFEGRMKREEARTRTLRFEVRDKAGVLIATKTREEEWRGGRWKATKNAQRWLRPDGSAGLSKREGETKPWARVSDLLYRLEKLRDADPRAVVILTEGERKADDLAALGVTCALGCVGGANDPPSETVLSNLAGRTVYLWPDNDAPGRKMMAEVKRRLLGVASEVFVIEWPEAPEKGDASDWIAEKRRTLEDLGALLDAAQARSTPRPPWSVNFSQALKLVMEELDRRSARQPIDVTPSGLRTLDRYLGGGFLPGEVYLLGAPTGGGKTTLMQSFAVESARRGRRVFLVSPEMSLREIGRRALAREVGGLSFADVWGRPDLVERVMPRAASLIGLPIVLVDKPDITLPEVFEEAQRLSREPEGLGLVLIDYAQQVVSEGDGRKPRYLAVGDVMTDSIVISKKLRVPVVLASQVNYVKDGPGGRPDYTFRESAKLEHGSTVTLIFDRANPYVADEARPEDEVVIDAKILCKKNRLGNQFGRVDVRWDKAAFNVFEPEVGLDERELREARDPSDGSLVTADTEPPQLPPGMNAGSLSTPDLYDE